LIDDGDDVFRTCFVNGRGDEALGSTWSHLDLSALGRQEKWEDSPEGYPQTPPYEWWPRHDEYDVGAWAGVEISHTRRRLTTSWARSSTALTEGTDAVWSATPFPARVPLLRPWWRWVGAGQEDDIERPGG
jgi:hypothetical protein